MSPLRQHRMIMKYSILLLLVMNVLYGAKIAEYKWKRGQTFSQYLEAHNISKSLLKHISNADSMFLSDINPRYTIYELKDEDGMLLQALIPISEVMQIHLSKRDNSTQYDFDIIPIEFETNEYFAQVKLKNNLYTDTLASIQNKSVTEHLMKALKVLDGTPLHYGDTIAFIYTQRMRASKPYLEPKIKIVRVLTGGKEKFIYVDEEGEGFTQTNKLATYTVTGKRKVTYSKYVPVSKAKAMFGMPLRRIRVTSHFSYSRWHPILQRYRPHHGTDFGARKGTPLLAINAGTISYAGWYGSYGKVVKIRHGDGYESLYAHQSHIRVKVGERVKKGQVIGYVGNTGRSTGPHLHLGLMRYGRWIDPMTVLRKKSLKMSILKKFIKYENVNTTKYKTVTIKNVKENKAKLLHYIKNHTKTFKWEE